MQEHQQFPLKLFYDTLRNPTDIQKKFKPFILEYHQHNMHWIYQTVAAFYKIFTSPKQLPLIKFNTLLAVKLCFDTCQYALVTLIQVYLLNKITEVALFRSKVKDQSLLATYFTTEGYKETDHKDLKKISYNYVMLAIELVFVTSQIKKFRCVENIQIKQESRYAQAAQSLLDKAIKRPDKFSFFLPDYVKDNSQKYQIKLTDFGQDACEIYSEYFLGLMIAQLQTGKKGPLQIKSLLSFGDAYLTSAMINLCEQELSQMPEGLQNKRKYLNLFNEFVRWGDIEAVIMINNSDFVTKISVNICTVKGDLNVSQGENIYPEIHGKKSQKRQFYIDFLRCIETWADCIPLNEEGNESNVRRIYIFLKEEKKFKFPQNLILKRYRKQLDQNMKKNQQRNQKLLEIINNSDEDDSQIKASKGFDPNSAMTKKPPKTQPVTFEYLENQIELVETALEQIITTKPNDKNAHNNLSLQFQTINLFKQNWLTWLESIDLDSSDLQEEDEDKLEQIIIDGDDTMQALQIINPLIQMFNKKKLTLEDFLTRIKQTLDVHDDLTASRFKRLDLTKSIGKSMKKSINHTLQKSLTNTIQKSILNLSQHKNLTTSKFDSSNHKNAPVLAASMQKSKNLNQNSHNQNQIQKSQKSHLANSMFKSNNYSASSSVMRRSKMHSKLQKIKQHSEQIGQMVESRNANFQTLHSKASSLLVDKNLNKQAFKNIGDEGQEYFQQNKQIGIKGHQQVIKEEERSEFSNSRKSIQSKKNYKKEGSLKSSGNNNKSSELMQSPGSSKNFKSEKNITVVSKRSSKMQSLERESKKVVQDMDISNEADKIVVEYSDIDENEIEKKANEREKQQMIRNQMKRAKKKELQNPFTKIKIEQHKATFQQKHIESRPPQVAKSPKPQLKYPLSPRTDLKSPNTQKHITFSDENNEYDNVVKPDKKAKPLSSSPTPITQLPTKDKLADRLMPLNEDYGGKSQKLNNYDHIETPKRSDKLQKTKKSESKISIVSDDDSMKSSKSIKEKLKSRISQRRSQIKENTEISLESQIRCMKMQEKSNSSRSLNKRKGGLVVTQVNEKSRIQVKCNQEYNHLPNQGSSERECDLNKTKRVNQTEEDFKNRNSEVKEYKMERSDKNQQETAVEKERRQMNQAKVSKNIDSSSVDSKYQRKGISLSLGKRQSIINSRERESIIKQPQQQKQERKQVHREEVQHEGNLREEYFSNNNIRKSKDSNRQRIKKRLHSNRSGSDSDSSCGDIIKSPDDKPMIDSHHTTQDIEARLTQITPQKLQFKQYIQADLKKQIICPKSKQIEHIIKYGSKRNQIDNFIQHNPNARKAKSHDKHSYGSLLRDKASGREVSELQDKLKILETEARNMKTKLAVRDQEVKTFRNTSQRGFVEFTNPSQSNYFASSGGFKTSRAGSEKALFSPMAHQFLKAEFQNSSLIAQVKHAKSSQYKQYFEKVKGNTFKKTLLKSKSLIEKQDQIEIGCMNVRKQDFSLEVTVFISPLRFDLSDISYSIIHDENLTSQCHPKKIVSIQLKKQQKIHIKMSVKKVPFSIPEFELTYKSKSEYSTNYFRIPIPTLFNKFCELQAVPLSLFENKSFGADRTMITSEFKVNSKVVKLEKIKQILPNFSYSRTKQLHILTSKGTFKANSFWLIVKINEKNHGIIEGVMEEGENFKYLQFLLVTLKSIFEVQK